MSQRRCVIKFKAALRGLMFATGLSYYLTLLQVSSDTQRLSLSIKADLKELRDLNPKRVCVSDYFVCTRTWAERYIFTCDSFSSPDCENDGVICLLKQVFCFSSSRATLGEVEIPTFLSLQTLKLLEYLQKKNHVPIFNRSRKIYRALLKLRECQLQVKPKSTAYVDFLNFREDNVVSRSHNDKLAFATFLSGTEFLPAAQTLAYTLCKHHGSQIPLIIGTSKGVKLSREEENFFRVLHPNVEFLHWAVLPPPTRSKEHERWSMNYAKLQLFNMARYDKVCYIDADALIMRPLKEIFSLLLPKDDFLGVPDWGKWTRPPSSRINGGVLLIRPSEMLFTYMMQELYRPEGPAFRSEEAEQGFLQFFFGDDSGALPFKYNFQKTAIKWAPQHDRFVKVLHYVGTKPHTVWSDAKFLRTYRSENEKLKLKSIDQDDDMDESFMEANNLWRDAYLEATRLALNLTVYVAYHDSLSYKQLLQNHMFSAEVFQPISLTTALHPNNLSTSQLLPELKDNAHQLQVGETALFGAFFVDLMAPSQHIHKNDWIGFSTYNNPMKSTWREGASLDWTKVCHHVMNKKNNAILFWYGIPAHNYWDLMKVHHPGMQDVFRLILPRLFDSNNFVDGLPRMPDDKFWPFGSYIIMHTSQLKAYGRVELQFRQIFTKNYDHILQRRQCPFKSAEVKTANWERRCTGYVLERLLHIWAVMTDIELVFAVDDTKLRQRAACAIDAVHCFGTRSV